MEEQGNEEIGEGKKGRMEGWGKKGEGRKGRIRFTLHISRFTFYVSRFTHHVLMDIRIRSMSVRGSRSSSTPARLAAG